MVCEMKMSLIYDEEPWFCMHAYIVKHIDLVRRLLNGQVTLKLKFGELFLSDLIMLTKSVENVRFSK